MKTNAVIAAVAVATLMGLSACTQKQGDTPPAAPADVTVNPPAVNVTAPPAEPTSTSESTTTTTSPDPATGDPGSTTSTTTTTEKK